MEILVFYAIAIEPIKVQTHSASQIDRLNLIFVRDTYGNTKKLLERVVKLWFMSRKFWDSPSKTWKNWCKKKL